MTKLSTKGKVVKIQGEVNKAFKVFEKAHTKITSAIAKLTNVVEESESKVHEYKHKIATEVEHQEHALETLAHHNEMLEKLSTFLPKKPWLLIEWKFII